MALSKKTKLQVPRSARDDNKGAMARDDNKKKQIPRRSASRNDKVGRVHETDAAWMNHVLGSFGTGSAGQTVSGLVGEVKLRVAAVIADVDAPEKGGTRKRTAGELAGLLELVVREAGDQGKVVMRHTIKQLHHSGFLQEGALGHAPRLVNAEATLPMDGRRRRKTHRIRMWAEPLAVSA